MHLCWHREASTQIHVSLIRAGGKVMKTRHAWQHPISEPWICASMSCLLLQVLPKITDRREATLLTLRPRISFSWTHQHFLPSFPWALFWRIHDKWLIYQCWSVSMPHWGWGLPFLLSTQWWWHTTAKYFPLGLDYFMASHRADIYREQLWSPSLSEVLSS